MQILCDHDIDLSLFESLSKSLLAASLEGLAPDLPDHLIPRDAKFTFENPETGRRCAYLIKDGCLALSKNGNTLVVVEQGELVGIEGFVEDVGKLKLEYSSEFAAKVDVYDLDSIVSHISKDLVKPWTEYLCLMFKVYRELFAVSLQATVDQDNAILCFEIGETIIEEGTKGEDLYNMVSGSADVFVKDVKVGEVNSGELFGAIAALTGEVRTATVIATSPCMISSMNNKNFINLVRANPKLGCKLVEDMAGKIIALNKKLISN